MSDWQKTLRDDSISTLEQLRAVKLAIVAHCMRVAVSGDEPGALADVRSDLRPADTLPVQEGDTSMAERANVESWYPCVAASASERGSQPVSRHAGEQRCRGVTSHRCLEHGEAVELGVDRFGELAREFEIRLARLAPHQVGVGRIGEAARDRLEQTLTQGDGDDEADFDATLRALFATRDQHRAWDLYLLGHSSAD